MSEEIKNELSFGQKSVGMSFTPDSNHEVHNCNKEFADIIDRMHYLRMHSQNHEVKRMASIAITEAHIAHLWAVQAITWER